MCFFCVGPDPTKKVYDAAREKPASTSSSRRASLYDDGMRLLALAAACSVFACATNPTTDATPTAATTTTTKAAAHATLIDWQPWGAATFARASAKHRLLLVTLVTEWCHWCHVMDEKTWGDPAVAALVADRFIAVRVDADARPDLAERYADWGWPALALLTPEAQPVTEWKGYQPARRFETELLAYVKDLDDGRALARKPPAKDLTTKPLLAIRDSTRAQLDATYDVTLGGWGTTQKYPLWAPVKIALLRAGLDGAAAALARVRQTLENEANLIDRVDGGMFQYSLQSVWTAPHYEKLADINGTALENYADAFAATGDDRFKDAAGDLARYALTILRRDDGAFFANQDADVGTRGEHASLLGKDYYALPSRAARAQVGTPFIDRHVYASHNGRLIAGLARYAAVSGDVSVGEAAVKAMAVLQKNHKVGAGFSHAEGRDDDDVFHLADQVAVGHALVLLAELTGDPQQRRAARDVAHFIKDAFEDDSGGFFAHTVSKDDVGVFAERRKSLKHNGEAASLLLQVGRLEEDVALTASAERALAAFANEAVVADEGRMVGEYLLALEEHLREPLHFALVGQSTDPALQALLSASLRVFAPHRLIDVQAPGKYPDLGKPSLYICGATFCSAPITDPGSVAAKAAKYTTPPG